MELENTIEIARPAADVYRFVATEHRRNHPRWDTGILDFTQEGEARWSPGWSRAGASASVSRVR